MSTGDLHKKICEDQSSSSRGMIADTQTNWSQYSAPRPGRSKKNAWAVMSAGCQIIDRH